MTMDNRGFKVESRFKKFFKGTSICYDAVDFQTSKCYYEVKSCNLFNKCFNGNGDRRFKKIPHKTIKTSQLGRFWINVDNHFLLKKLAEENNKVPKYIFAVAYGGQLIWKIVDWMNLRIDKSRSYEYIRIKDIFGDLI